MKTKPPGLVPITVIGLLLAICFGLFIFTRLNQPEGNNRQELSAGSEKTNYELPRFYPTVKFGN